MKKVITSKYTKDVKYILSKKDFEKMDCCCLISLYKQLDDNYIFVGMIYSADIQTIEWNKESDTIDSINGVTFALQVYPMISEAIYNYYMQVEE